MRRIGEHLMIVRAPYYKQIDLNEKTVEARLFYDSYKKYKVGEEIVFRKFKGSASSVRRIITAIEDYVRSHS